ncbi:MAG: alternative ribosome rescue aminoacyl-tRNA hydrolase ArfB [Isosphaeraceae bacterium]
MLKIDDRFSIPLGEFRWEFSRAGGPGGQNVNKVNSKVVLRWTPAASPSLPAPVRDRLLRLVAHRLTGEGDLLVMSQATRDQGRNLQDCLEKLRALVLSAVHPPKIRRPTRPTRASQVRRVDAKSRRSETKRARRKPDAD